MVFFFKLTKNIGRFGSLGDILVQGTVSPGYETVKEMFEENFRQGREKNAQLCVYVKEKKVVDLWGSSTGDKSYNGDTLVNVFSSTKSITAIVVAKMVEKGFINYGSKIGQYWPEFGQNGKEDVTVADLMRHEAGLASFDTSFDLEDLLTHNIKKNKVGEVVERQKQWFKEGKVREYHAISRGWIANELVRRVDPHERTIGEILRKEICEPLGARAFIGLTDQELSNSCDLDSMKTSFVLLQSLRPKALGRGVDPNFLQLMMMAIYIMIHKEETRKDGAPSINGWSSMADTVKLCNNPLYRKGETPSANGNCCARGLAILGACMANKGTLNGAEVLEQSAWEALHANPVIQKTFFNFSTNFTQGGVDLAQPRQPAQGTQGNTVKSLPSVDGFFGWMGLGGSIFKWNPDSRIGFGYVPSLLTMIDMGNVKGNRMLKEVAKCAHKLDNNQQ